MTDPVLATLTNGIAALDLSLNTAQQQQLITYLQLLHKWNQVYNLTAIRDIPRMVTQHVLDSLTVVAHITQSPVLDVGSGAGLPGIPLAIAMPEVPFVLIDSQHKRTRFLQHVIAALSLTNVAVITARIEQYRSITPFYTIVARAVDPCAQLVRVSVDLVGSQGRWLLLKGDVMASEYADLPENTHFSRVIPLTVPGLAKQRQLVEIVKSTI